MVKISGESSKLFWSMHSGRVTKIHLFSPPLFKDKGLRGTGHDMSIKNLILGVNSVTISCLIHSDSLLQNVTAIFLQNATEVY